VVRQCQVSNGIKSPKPLSGQTTIWQYQKHVLQLRHLSHQHGRSVELRIKRYLTTISLAETIHGRPIKFANSSRQKRYYLIAQKQLGRLQRTPFGKLCTDASA
jgi:hypothetical protein